jgi:hypothetical protein
MAKAKLGSGARFKALKKKLAAKGATNPGALAGWIGRKKYGPKKMAKLSAKGRKKNLPGMSVHPVVNCNEASRRKSVSMGEAMSFSLGKNKHF